MDEKPLMAELFGESATTRIIDFLLEKRPFDTTKEEIIRGTGVSRNTFFRAWERMEKFGLAKKTRTIGRATLYVINDSNQVVRKLLELEYSLIENEMGKQGNRKALRA